MKETWEEFTDNIESNSTIIFPWKKLSEANPKDLYIDVMPSGFKSLDNAKVLKKNKGELIVVGGRPSHGKSAFLFQLAYNLSKKQSVLVLSYEMDYFSIVTRMIALHKEISITKIQNKDVKEETLNNLFNEMKELNYYIVSNYSNSTNSICDLVRFAYKKLEIKAVVIDYLQLLNSEKGHSTSAEIGSITKSLKQLALELEIPIIIASQLSRAAGLRGTAVGSYKPILSDLRDSGSIEQDADIIIFIHREYLYTKKEEDKDFTEVLISKNRNGYIDNIKMKWIDYLCKLKEI